MPGNITTFYSYKGGTGRTMALANTACVLAERLAPGEKVLVVDWDLEAPGLHRFFPPRLRAGDAGLDLGLDAGLGLIDLFIDLAARLPANPPASEDEADDAVGAALDGLELPRYIGQTEQAAIHILRAGRNDDGQYGKRVNTFDWEALFRRAPGVYHAFAERLARQYRWVLIDSRTGVTDISGICTSLLPEKLVVVFTPNRQSLSGVHELVQRATAYRRASDDLRPLLVLPLPSRIEASMDKLRSHWRHGRPEDGITGYQPMFEALMAQCYGLPVCDLGPYFDAVQIQQSPDCAYGEVISVRSGSGDRFSLASSYRVFVDRLVAGTPPWQVEGDAPAAVDDPFGPETEAAPLIPQMPERAAPAASAAAAPWVFLSFAAEDRDRVEPVKLGLQARGLQVIWDRQPLTGQRWEDAVAEVLDSADVVVVFWSRAALGSESVREVGEEGLRRGVLLPVLLDDTRLPLSFRTLQAADLRRDFDSQLPRLLDAIQRIAMAAPGEPTVLVPPPAPALRAAALAPPQTQSEPGRRGPAWVVPSAALLTVVLAGLGFWGLQTGGARSGGEPSQAASSALPLPAEAASNRLLPVPDFVGKRAEVVSEVAKALNLNVIVADGKAGVDLYSVKGLIVAQKPAAGTLVAPGSTVSLSVHAQATTVPGVGGLTLDAALARLRESGLELGAVESVEGSQARNGTIVLQVPQAGTAVPAGSKVRVGVAAERSAYDSIKQQ